MVEKDEKIFDPQRFLYYSTVYERHIQTKKEEAQTHSWFPGAYEQQKWQQGDFSPPSEGTQAPFRLMLSKIHRLAKEKDFEAVFSKGKIFRHRLFICRF